VKLNLILAYVKISKAALRKEQRVKESDATEPYSIH